MNKKRGREAEADVWFVQGKERHTGRERDTDELKNGKERNREKTLNTKRQTIRAAVRQMRVN